MQAELQVWHVVAGHGSCKGIEGPLRLTSKIGSEEKAGNGLSPVCPVSVAIELTIGPRRPGDSDLSDIPAFGCLVMHHI